MTGLAPVRPVPLGPCLARVPKPTALPLGWGTPTSAAVRGVPRRSVKYLRLPTPPTPEWVPGVRASRYDVSRYEGRRRCHVPEGAPEPRSVSVRWVGVGAVTRWAIPFEHLFDRTPVRSAWNRTSVRTNTCSNPNVCSNDSDPQPARTPVRTRPSRNPQARDTSRTPTGIRNPVPDGLSGRRCPTPGKRLSAAQMYPSRASPRGDA